MRYRLSSIFASILVVAVLLSWSTCGVYILRGSFLALLAVLVSNFTRYRVAKKLRWAVYLSALLLAALVVSLGPATGYLIHNSMKNGNARIAGAYRITYMPVTDFISALPEPVPNIFRRYVLQSLPDDAILDEDWPKQEELLIGWTEPNKKEPIGMGIWRRGR
jgi:hypothetical protein